MMTLESDDQIPDVHASQTCYAGRVVGCSQGSYQVPAQDGAERMTRCTELHKTAARIVEFMRRFSTHL